MLEKVLLKLAELHKELKKKFLHLNLTKYKKLFRIDRISQSRLPIQKDKSGTGQGLEREMECSIPTWHNISGYYDSRWRRRKRR